MSSVEELARTICMFGTGTVTRAVAGGGLGKLLSTDISCGFCKVKGVWS